MFHVCSKVSTPVKGPLPGCPLHEPHAWRYCRHCKNAYMRIARASGKHLPPYDWKVRARKRMAMAVRRGTFLKPETCERCGFSMPQMHHKDYTKPFEVEWLCKMCHKRADAVMRNSTAGGSR